MGGAVTLLQHVKTTHIISATTLEARLKLLVCSEQRCVPETFSYSTTLATSEDTPNPDTIKQISAAKAILPIPFSNPLTWQDTDTGSETHVKIDAKNGIHHCDALPVTRLETAPTISCQAQTGTLTLQSDQTADTMAQTNILIQSDQSPGLLMHADTTQPNKNQSLLLLFASAIIGGLLLNLMPCVFPILSLKAFSLLQAGTSEEKARSDAIGYTLGVLITVLGLAGTILTLRSGGSIIGWAFQLQNPLILSLLFLLVLGIAFNLAGLFELPSLRVSGSAKHGFSGAVSTGALAAFIATPCTGPFMASAIGAAMILPSWQALCIFFGLGIGIALPFLAIGFIPALRRRLPRPGNWMNTLKNILSIPMFITAIGLLWILGRQSDLALVIGVLSCGLIMALGLWWQGSNQRRHQSHRLPWLIPTLSIIFNASLVSIHQNAIAAVDQQQITPYSETVLDTLIEQHHPVFLYFTADWCLTCKVNEGTSLSNAEVQESFKRHGITIMRGDWTQGDTAITSFLTKNHAAGVPLYLWYPNSSKATELPQILTPSLMLSLAAQLDEEKAK